MINFFNGYWIMFLFGFLLDKINLFPFMLGLFFGVFISNDDIQNINLESINNINLHIFSFLNKIIDKISTKQNNNNN